MARISRLKDAIIGLEERYEVFATSVKEKVRQVEKYQKDVEALNILQDEVVDLKKVLHGALELTTQNVNKVNNRLVKISGRSI